MWRTSYSQPQFGSLARPPEWSSYGGTHSAQLSSYGFNIVSTTYSSTTPRVNANLYGLQNPTPQIQPVVGAIYSSQNHDVNPTTLPLSMTQPTSHVPNCSSSASYSVNQPQSQELFQMNSMLNRLQMGQTQLSQDGSGRHNGLASSGPNAVQIAARQVIPRELPPFSGNPQDWPLFYSSFQN